MSKTQANVRSMSVVRARYVVKKMIDAGDIETCPGCGALNSLAFFEGCKRFTTRLEPMYDDGLYIVYHGGGFDSVFGGACGKCDNSYMPVDSPINCECYTHNPV